MFKKKQKNTQKEPKEPTLQYRLDTESDVLPQKQSKTRADLCQRFEERSQAMPSSRFKLKCKELEKLFSNLKNLLEEELHQLLIGEPIWNTYQALMDSRLFRVRDRSQDQVLDDLGRVIQALELMYSKLRNNEKVKDILYVKDESELLLFFKHLFGKPYTVCNMPSFRKVLNTIWQQQIFQSFQVKKMADHLRHWCVGIQYPLNPAFIPLHRLVFSDPTTIKKHALLQTNNVGYCHIDAGDCMGLTPLLLAVHNNKTLAYQHLIKSGANMFRCPLTVTKRPKKVSKSPPISCSSSSTSSSTSSKLTVTVQISFPFLQRRQYNIFETLLHYRQYQQIVNILSLNQVYKLKTLKKGCPGIQQILTDIPDCCLQIEWKSCKGFLSFKQLPKDIITVYKKKGDLRIDYHVDDLQKLTPQRKHYSILIKTSSPPTPKLQYYLIDHSTKKIHSLTKQLDPRKLKLRYQQLTQFGNIQDQYITYIKSVTKTASPSSSSSSSSASEPPRQYMEVSAQYCYENVCKAQLYAFGDLGNYERGLFQSQVVDYRRFEDSETGCTIGQGVGTMPKVKPKLVRHWSNFKIEWTKQKVNLKHISLILSLLDKKSPLFLKLSKLFNIFLTEQAYKESYTYKLPYKMAIELGSDFSLQAQIKNLTYMSLDDAVFGLEYRTKTMAYQEDNAGLDSLQETKIMSENYSIHVSRFLGNTERLLEVEEEEANRKFEEMLSKEIAGEESEEEDSGDRKEEITNREDFHKKEQRKEG